MFLEGDLYELVLQMKNVFRSVEGKLAEAKTKRSNENNGKKWKDENVANGDLKKSLRNQVENN